MACKRIIYSIITVIKAIIDDEKCSGCTITATDDEHRKFVDKRITNHIVISNASLLKNWEIKSVHDG